MAARHYFLWQSAILIPLVAIGISAAMHFNSGGFEETSFLTATFWASPGMAACITVIAVSAGYSRRRQEIFGTLLPAAGAGVLTVAASLALGYGGWFLFFLLPQFAAAVAAWRMLDCLSEFSEAERRPWSENKNSADMCKMAYYLRLLVFYILPIAWTIALYSLKDAPTFAAVAIDLLFAATQIGYAVWLDRTPLRARVFEATNATSATRHYFLWQSVLALPTAIVISIVKSYGMAEGEPDILLLGCVLTGGWVAYGTVIAGSAIYVRKLREVFVILLPIFAIGVLIAAIALWMGGNFVISMDEHADGYSQTIGVEFVLMFLLQLAAPIAAWIALGTLTTFEKPSATETGREQSYKKRKIAKHYLVLLGFYTIPTGLMLAISGSLVNVRSPILFVLTGLWFVATEIWCAKWLDRQYTLQLSGVPPVS